jgi:hypothetical protein
MLRNSQGWNGRPTSASAHCGLSLLRISITRLRELNFWPLKSAGMPLSCLSMLAQSRVAGASPDLEEREREVCARDDSAIGNIM